MAPVFEMDYQLTMSSDATQRSCELTGSSYDDVSISSTSSVFRIANLPSPFFSVKSIWKNLSGALH
jgi:hypothetical protein